MDNLPQFTIDCASLMHTAVYDCGIDTSTYTKTLDEVRQGLHDDIDLRSLEQYVIRSGNSLWRFCLNVLNKEKYKNEQTEQLKMLLVFLKKNRVAWSEKHDEFRVYCY